MLFVLLALSLNVQAEADSCSAFGHLVSEEFLNMPAVIFPGAMKRNVHYIHRNYKYNHASCSSSEVWVQGPLFAEHGVDSNGNKSQADGPTYSMLGSSFCMPKSEFQRERILGQSVFETRVASGSKNEGTSFLVGKNVVMTNYHIAGGGANPNDCRKVEIALNEPGEQTWLSCKKILYCEKEHDFCFVEMNPPFGREAITDVTPKVKINCQKVAAQEAKLIGNNFKLGIQASDGDVEAQMSNGQFKHKVPMVGGASGSPIFNKNGEVMGLNFGHSNPNENFVSTNLNDTNFGTSMNYIFNKIRTERVAANISFDQNKQKNLDVILNSLPVNSNCR
ncbi:MAG: serine protease [Bacteriovoracaceae bacterium]|nr:serine protease [Bacteriovoracaceae bacterium]